MATAGLTATDKHTLITHRLQEVLGDDRLQKILAERDLRVYWGTATTGRPHIAYFVPMTKIADFLHAGCEVTSVLLSLSRFDPRSQLTGDDSLRWSACLSGQYESPVGLVGPSNDLLRARHQSDVEIDRCATGQTEIRARNGLSAVEVTNEPALFPRSFVLPFFREYTLDVYRLSSVVTEHDAKKAGAEVVKQVSSALLSGLLYPGLQVRCLLISRPIMDRSSRHWMKNISKSMLNSVESINARSSLLPKRCERASVLLPSDYLFSRISQSLATANVSIWWMRWVNLSDGHSPSHTVLAAFVLVPGLTGDKMSASVAESKIDLLDTAEEIKKKLKKAFCEPGNIQTNGILAFCKSVIFPLLKDERKTLTKLVRCTSSSLHLALVLPRGEQYGGPMSFRRFEELEQAFQKEVSITRPKRCCTACFSLRRSIRVIWKTVWLAIWIDCSSRFEKSSNRKRCKSWFSTLILLRQPRPSKRKRVRRRTRRWARARVPLSLPRETIRRQRKTSSHDHVRTGRSDRRRSGHFERQRRDSLNGNGGERASLGGCSLLIIVNENLSKPLLSVSWLWRK